MKKEEVQYRKNDVIEFDIIDYGNEGEGIGKTDAFTWFIKDTVIGDRVRASVMKLKKNLPRQTDISLALKFSLWLVLRRMRPGYASLTITILRM